MAAVLLLQSTLKARARGGFTTAPKHYVTCTHPSAAFASFPPSHRVHAGFLTSFTSELSLSNVDAELVRAKKDHLHYRAAPDYKG